MGETDGDQDKLASSQGFLLFEVSPGSSTSIHHWCRWKEYSRVPEQPMVKKAASPSVRFSIGICTCRAVVTMAVWSSIIVGQLKYGKQMGTLQGNPVNLKSGEEVLNSANHRICHKGGLLGPPAQVGSFRTSKTGNTEERHASALGIPVGDQ